MKTKRIYYVFLLSFPQKRESKDVNIINQEV